MREIRFRAYCKSDKEMFYSSMYQKITGIVFGLSSFFSEIFDIEDTIMQYTGLKDKNGKEIYLDDLLRDDKNRVFQVVEDDRVAGTGYRLKLISTWNNNDHIKINQCVDFYSWMVSENDNCLEIVGNIYEHSYLLDINPELMEQK